MSRNLLHVYARSLRDIASGLKDHAPHAANALERLAADVFENAEVVVLAELTPEAAAERDYETGVFMSLFNRPDDFQERYRARMKKLRPDEAGA